MSVDDVPVKDEGEKFRFFNERAQQVQEGNLHSTDNLVVSDIDGNRFDKNEQKAVLLLEHAAEQGRLDSTANLGASHSDGLGDENDHEEEKASTQSLKHAADLGREDLVHLIDSLGADYQRVALQDSPCFRRTDRIVRLTPAKFVSNPDNNLGTASEIFDQAVESSQYLQHTMNALDKRRYLRPVIPSGLTLTENEALIISEAIIHQGLPVMKGRSPSSLCYCPAYSNVVGRDALPALTELKEAVGGTGWIVVEQSGTFKAIGMARNQAYLIAEIETVAAKITVGELSEATIVHLKDLRPFVDEDDVDYCAVELATCTLAGFKHGAAAIGQTVTQAVGAAIGGAVGGPVGDAIGDVVGDAVGGPVGDAIGDVVGNATGDAIGGVVADGVVTALEVCCVIL